MSLGVFAPCTLFSEIYFLMCMFGGNDKLNMKQKILGGLFKWWAILQEAFHMESLMQEAF